MKFCYIKPIQFYKNCRGRKCLSVFPLAKLQSLAGQEIAVMRSNGRLVACGGIGGDIVLKDFRTMKTEHTIDAHQGISISLLYVLQLKDVLLEIFFGGGQLMSLNPARVHRCSGQYS